MLRALRPVILKEFRQIRRDPTSLGMLLVLPTALIILVGYALDFDVKHVPLVVYDQNRSPESRALIERLGNTESFHQVGRVVSYDEIERLFLEGVASVAIVVPPAFGRDLLAGREAKVQILVDGSDANTAGQAVANASSIVANHSTQLMLEAFRRVGRREYVPIDFQPRVWYNPDLVTSRFLVPGLIGFILVLTAVVSTSLTVVREKERGTMEQIMVSPLKPSHLILGKTIPYMAISLVAATAILVLGYLLFDVEVKGSLLLLYAAIFAILLGGLGQGLLISTITDSQQVAFMVSIMTSLLPSFLLSGFVFPISSMPDALQVISNIAVNKFFLNVIRAVMLKGAGLSAVWDQLLYMLIFASVMLGVSSRRMQKRTL
jgi:ABC-2 type transport system permease protein